MRRLRFPLRPLATAATLGLCFAGCGASPASGPAALQRPPASQDERMAWWREARFGMFLHWGLYAIPAGKWGNQTGYGEWIRDSARIPIDVYEQFRPNWNPEHFDADEWARLAADAGMRYVVITSKHHDGFCLWDSALTDWDVGASGNRRDVLGELAAACRRRGIVFCTYHSIMDWHHPDYLPRRPWETNRSTTGADFERFERYLHGQVKELVERYQPGVMWFDGEWENTWNHDRGLRLFQLCRELAPAMIVNNRVDVHRGGMGGFSQAREAVGDFATPEQEIPATGLPGVDWESCMTMNSHWGWNAADTQWKSAKELVRNLIDVASKGGNYLLNVGPRADGTFPPAAVERLAQIGAWMQANGEAIHGTTASPFDTPPWYRCTVRERRDGATLYVHVFDAPPQAESLVRMPGLANRVRSVRFVSGKGSAVPFVVDLFGHSLNSTAYQVALTAPDPVATVLAFELEGPLDVVRAPRFAGDDTQFVRTLQVPIVQTSANTITTYTLDGSAPTATSPRADAPVRIDASCVLRAASFRGGAQVTDVVERTFTKIDPLPPVKANPQKPGLVCEHFAVDWQAIPDDRAALTPNAREVVFSVGPLQKPGEKVAFVYRGFLLAGADDVHRFALTSDDGSKLWIDGQLVVDHDGLHGASEKRGAIALAKGPHAIEVVWFNRTGGAELELKWALPGQPFEPLAAAMLRH